MMIVQCHVQLHIYTTKDRPESRHSPGPGQNQPIFRIPVPVKIPEFGRDQTGIFTILLVNLLENSEI